MLIFLTALWEKKKNVIATLIFPGYPCKVIFEKGKHERSGSFDQGCTIK